MEFLWELKDSTDALDKDTLSKILFSKNVQLEKEKNILFTEKATYNMQTHLLKSKNKSTFFSPKSYLVSQKGFTWDLEKDSLAIKGGFDGISYKKQ